MSRTFAPHSLVRYNNPILVGTKTKDAKGVKTMRAKLEAGLSSTEQVLNSILPPREWTDGGKLWVQYVSSTPATTSDVLAVQQHLDAKLAQRQAKPSGICPIREELYSQVTTTPPHAHTLPPHALPQACCVCMSCIYIYLTHPTYPFTAHCVCALHIHISPPHPLSIIYIYTYTRSPVLR
jgi:hypothetical protein